MTFLAASSMPQNFDSLEPLVRVLRTEWPRLSGARPNILLVGDRMATDAAVGDRRSTYQSPVIERYCGGLPLRLPPSESVSTMILHDVTALSLEEQQMLSDWLCNGNGRPQVITTSDVPVFPLVKSGAFLATLYYRLNTIYVEVTAFAAAMEPSA